MIFSKIIRLSQFSTRPVVQAVCFLLHILISSISIQRAMLGCLDRNICRIPTLSALPRCLSKGRIPVIFVMQILLRWTVLQISPKCGLFWKILLLVHLGAVKMLKTDRKKPLKMNMTRECVANIVVGRQACLPAVILSSFSCNLPLIKWTIA